MKNFFKLFAVVLAVSFLLISCSEVKGGTIKVTNGLDTKLPTYVIIVKGADYGSVIDKLEKEGTVIAAGATQDFKIDEDGIYTVVAMPPVTPPFTQPVTIALGNTEKVTVK